MTDKRTALALIAGVLAAAFMPREPVTPSVWASQNFVVPDGPRSGQLMDFEFAPYLREPLDFFADDHPGRKGVFRKSKQIGVTTLAMAACGYTVCEEPADLFLIEPTDSSLAEFVSLKLQPAIEASPALAARVAPQTSRSGKGSTTFIKRFPGGTLLMGIATSTADLRGKTRRKIIRDEASEYPADLGGQGSPHDMIGGAYEAFQASADYKDLWISTPTIKGACAIDAEFEAGDQRYWHVPCPNCGGRFYFDSSDAGGFRCNAEPPYAPHYVAPCCGYPVMPHERDALVRAGAWVATSPGPGRHYSWHFDTLASPLVPWDVYAERYVAAKKDPAKRKTFDNLSRGRAHEVAVDAPDHMLLMQRAEDYRRGHIPPQALLLSIGADVQMRGIYYEVLAVAPDGQSWVIDADYLDGATTDHDAGAFAALTELYRREWPDAFGHRRRADEFLIDTGYRTQVVYTWTRLHPGTKAIKGEDGWGRPALGVATDQDVDYRGRRIKGGAKLRAVGTWPIKGVFYSYLALTPTATGSALVYPAGYCHFGQFLDENYYRMLTSEFLGDYHEAAAAGKRTGRTMRTIVARRAQSRPLKRWLQRPGRDNHWLDCRIYNMAGLDAYMTSFTSDDWLRLAKERGVPADLCNADLFTTRAFAVPAVAPIAGEEHRPVALVPAQVEDHFTALARLNADL
jgi:phage terminase large subunit GpA-like protein